VFQSAAGLVNATCFDVLDACASWLRGVDIAHHLIASGGYRLAMVLNCETNFAEYEPPRISSRDDAELLWSGYTVGEAATATIVSRGGPDAQYRTSFRNTGGHVHDCEIPLPHAAQFQTGNGAGATAMLFQARPNELASAAIRQLRRQYWSDPVLPSLDYDVIFGHSVSVPVSRTTLRALKLASDRYYEIFPAYGNVVSASLPLAMSLAAAEGRLRRGSRVLLIMGGAGITTALSTFIF
jgi:3-oxoacyl-[acyl-carrier-protein] synthase III